MKITPYTGEGAKWLTLIELWNKYKFNPRAYNKEHSFWLGDGQLGTMTPNMAAPFETRSKLFEIRKSDMKYGCKIEDVVLMPGNEVWLTKREIAELGFSTKELDVRMMRIDGVVTRVYGCILR